MIPAGYNTGLILAVVSALTFASYNAGLRYFLGELTVWQIFFLRGSLGLAVLGLAAKIFRKRLWGTRGKLLSFVGFCSFLSTLLVTLAIAHLPLYQAIALLYLYPTFSIMLAVPINGEKAHRRDFAFLGLALFGGLMMIWPDEEAGLSLSVWHLAGIAGSFCYALAAVLTRRLGDDNSGLEPLFHYSLYAAAISLVMVIFVDGGLGAMRASQVGHGLFLAGFAICAQITLFASLRWLPAYRVGLIGNLEILGSALASWFIFHDPVSVRAIAGGLIIIIVASRLKGAPKEVS